MEQKRCLSFLLYPTAVTKLSKRKLIHMIKPQFSDVRSNRRMREEKTYTQYVAYLKEVDGKYIVTEVAHNIVLNQVI